MAVMTRVWTPACCSASCNAKALITVASMPMTAPTSSYGRRLGGGFAGIANLEAHEARNRDIFAQLRDLCFYQVLDGGGVFLDERLLIQADFLVVLVHAAFDDLVDHLLGL